MTDAPIARGREWVEGLQSRDGGWGAFDADNSYYLSQQHSLSPIMARCWTRRPRMFRAAASACWRSLVSRMTIRA